LPHTRDNFGWDHLAVSGPIVTVFVAALVLVTALSMPQKESKVKKVEVWDRGVEATRKTPGQCHHQVTKVVDMARISPPSAGHQTSSSFGFNEFDI
jgi:hypothetical protein